jgi:hypothetical protein
MTSTRLQYAEVVAASFTRSAPMRRCAERRSFAFRLSMALAVDYFSRLLGKVAAWVPDMETTGYGHIIQFTNF